MKSSNTFRCVFDISDISSKYISDIDISGKYQIAVGYNAFAISKDYGFTWEQKPEFESESYTLIGVAISNDGKYILVGGQNTPLFYSNDGGGSFIQKFTFDDWFEIKMSKSGQYQTAIGPTNEIYISNNYGETFTIHNTSGTPILSFFSNYLAMSYDGKYQSITLSQGIYRSNDYGQTWNVIDLSSITNSNDYLVGIGMSGNGKIQMAGEVNSGNVYKSTDYGVTWTYIYNIPDNTEPFFISLSETGQYVLFPDYGKNILTSNDYGNTFTNNLKIDDQSQLTFGTAGWYPCSISNTGQYQTVCEYDRPGALSGYIYTSNDYGKNFYIRNSSGEKNWLGCCMN